jgi:hypothetical protein
LLKLRALDTEDLNVISAHMQDALVRVADIKFDSKQRKFALLANRFAWEAQPSNERHRTGLHFENVLGASRKGFKQSASGVILSLLAISFTEIDAPAGEVALTFSGGHEIKLKVEYLDCMLRDLGAAWSADNKPDHGA